MPGEIDVLKKAAIEWRERLRKAERRSDAIWNSAVYACMDLFGDAHGPVHGYGACMICWIHTRLRSILRLEASGYVPVKERMRNSLADMQQKCQLQGATRKGYLKGLSDMMSVIDEQLEDFE